MPTAAAGGVARRGDATPRAGVGKAASPAGKSGNATPRAGGPLATASPDGKQSASRVTSAKLALRRPPLQELPFQVLKDGTARRSALVRPPQSPRHPSSSRISPTARSASVPHICSRREEADCELVFLESHAEFIRDQVAVISQAGGRCGASLATLANAAVAVEEEVASCQQRHAALPQEKEKTHLLSSEPPQQHPVQDDQHDQRQQVGPQQNYQEQQNERKEHTLEPSCTKIRTENVPLRDEMRSVVSSRDTSTPRAADTSLDSRVSASVLTPRAGMASPRLVNSAILQPVRQSCTPEKSINASKNVASKGVTSNVPSSPSKKQTRLGRVQSLPQKQLTNVHASIHCAPGANGSMRCATKTAVIATATKAGARESIGPRAKIASGKREMASSKHNRGKELQSGLQKAPTLVPPCTALSLTLSEPAPEPAPGILNFENALECMGRSMRRPQIVPALALVPPKPKAQQSNVRQSPGQASPTSRHQSPPVVQVPVLAAAPKTEACFVQSIARALNALGMSIPQLAGSQTREMDGRAGGTVGTN